MPFHPRPSPAQLLSPMSLPSSPSAYSRQLHPSSLVHPSSHAEYLLSHLEKPVTCGVVHYLVSRIHQILSCAPVADCGLDPAVVPPLELFASILIKSTFITLPTIICALLYLDRLEISLSSRSVYNHNPTSPHCILLSVLIVASKHQNDSSLTNAAWCDAVAWTIKRCKLGKSRSVEMLIENVFSLSNIMAMERQCLDHLEFDLVVSEEEVEYTLVSMFQYFANPMAPSFRSELGGVCLDDDVESWLNDVTPDHVIPVTEDMGSEWFESPQPSFQYLITRRASAPAILEHPDQPAICGAPVSYAAFPSDVSDGVSSYPTTPSAPYTAKLDFDIEELHEEVEIALENTGYHIYSADIMSAMQFPVQPRYSESDFEDEDELQLYSRGRSTTFKPLGESDTLSYNSGALPVSLNGFAPPLSWM